MKRNMRRNVSFLIVGAASFYGVSHLITDDSERIYPERSISVEKEIDTIKEAPSFSVKSKKTIHIEEKVEDPKQATLEQSIDDELSSEIKSVLLDVLRKDESDAIVDLKTIVELVDSHPQALRIIFEQFEKRGEDSKKDIIFNALLESKNEAVDEFLLSQVQSDSPEIRADIYKLIGGRKKDLDQSYTLIEASQYEQDSQALIYLISALAKGENEGSATFTLTFDRIKALTEHGDSQVSSHALTALSRFTEHQDALNILSSHLESPSKSLKITAMQGLYNFQQIDATTYKKLEAILESSSEDKDVKALAENLLRAKKTSSNS